MNKMIAALNRFVPNAARIVPRAANARAFSAFPAPLTTLTEEEQAVRDAGMLSV